jgi:hypothetical protein
MHFSIFERHITVRGASDYARERFLFVRYDDCVGEFLAWKTPS